MRQIRWGRFFGVTLVAVLLCQNITGPNFAKAQGDFTGATGSGSTGNSTTSAPAVSYTGDQIKKWTDAFNGQDKNLRIVYSNTQPNNPPTVVPVGKDFVPADSASGRPPLLFKLVATSFNATVSTIKWLTFQAYQVDSSGQNPQIIPNFYFLMNDCSAKNTTGSGSSTRVDCFDLIYDIDQTSVYRGIFDDSAYPTGVVLINGNTTGIGILQNLGGLEISDAQINEIFGYIMNIPKDGSQNCQNGGVYTTGPPSATPPADGQTVQEIQKKISAVNQGVASNLDSSCAGAGWLGYWGITNVNNQTVGGDCGIGIIFGLGDIGKIFDKLTQCIFDNIFIPIVTWASDLVTKAAGISSVSPADWSASRRYLS